MIKTKCILHPIEYNDGTRISVMSKHILNDGETHRRIRASSYDFWFPVLAPPPMLARDYNEKDLPWEKFRERYLWYLETKEPQSKVKELAKNGLTAVVTFLCIEESPEHCHRRLLAETCKKYQPNLYLEIK